MYKVLLADHVKVAITPRSHIDFFVASLQSEYPLPAAPLSRTKP